MTTATMNIPAGLAPYEPTSFATIPFSRLMAEWARQLPKVPPSVPNDTSPSPGRARPPRQRHDGEREPEPIESILDKALGELHATGHRHNSTVWLACQLRDNYHDVPGGADLARRAVRDLARSFPTKAGDPYGEAEALADLADLWGTAPRRKSGRLKKGESEAGDTNKKAAPAPAAKPASEPSFAEPPFSLDLSDDVSDCDCPYSVTRTLRRRDNPDDLRTVSLRCKKMTCEACRRANVRDYQLRAQDGIRKDLRAGCTLALFDGEGVAGGAMAKRLRGVGGYLRCNLGMRRVVVCTVKAGSSLPLGFVAVTPAEAAAKLREVGSLLEHATPFEGAKRWRPLSLSAGWLRVSLKEKDQRIQTNSESADDEPSRPKFEVLRPHAVRCPRVVAEALRRRGFDPLFRVNRRCGKVQWSLVWGPIPNLPDGETFDLYGVLADLDALPREGGPTTPDLDAPLPEAEPLSVCGVVLNRFESAAYAACREAGRFFVPEWLYSGESRERLRAACRASGLAVAEGGAA